MRATLAELAALLAGAVEGDGHTLIHGIASLEHARHGDLTFLTDRHYAPRLAASQASAVLVAPQQPVDRPAIRVSNPTLALITLLERFYPLQHPAPGIDGRAVLAPDVCTGDQVSIGPYVVIGQGTRLGERVVVYPGTYIGADCEIGDDCILYANVSLYSRVRLGRQVIVHSGAVIGADGFGFYPLADGSYQKIPQVGRVVIGDAVEIGANTCIDRAMIGETIIESGVKIDNLVQVGHNTTIGVHSVLAGQVGLAGSVTVGPRVRMGGQVGVIDHVTVGEGASIVGQSGIPYDIEPGTTVWGSPAVAHTTFKRMHLYSQRLGELFQQVKHLQRRLEQLERRETPS
jgi:UDP-3-O-[3-hydroxymyristoyl] glucosamine N-acyltransferase